jgi:hypothetical protein
MDKTKQQSSEGGIVSSNTGPSSQVGGLFAGNPPSPGWNNQRNTKQSPDPNHPVHCEDCGIESYFVAGLPHKHKQTGSSSVPAPEMLEDDNPSPRFTSFSGVTLDRTRCGQLSEFHVLGDDGETWSSESDEWEAIAKEAGGFEVISSRSFWYHPLT